MKLAVTVLLISLAASSALGQAPTLRIVAEDPSLPAELFYGNIKVKPLRLRPGTNTAITIDDADFFVFQHYVDFLNRMPEPGGFAGWQSILNGCVPATPSCDRIHVSGAFFQSPEFQDRGYFAYRQYSVGFGRKPDFAEFVPDLRRISGFLDAGQLEAAKVAQINDFMARPAFVSRYNGLGNQAYVNLLVTTAGVTLANKQSLIDALNAGTKTRAEVLRAIMESTEVYSKYYNQSFVVMQYFGYLRR
ncbi:MAG: hypothetical protein ABI967_13530, partial [bacterium]